MARNSPVSCQTREEEEKVLQVLELAFFLQSMVEQKLALSPVVG